MRIIDKMFRTHNHWLWPLVCVLLTVGVVTACDSSIMPSDTHTHQWSRALSSVATCVKDGDEVLVCDLDPTHISIRSIDKDEEMGHEWGDWIETEAPTEKKEGEKTRTCALNSEHKEKRPIGTLDHTHVWDNNWTLETAPTCTTRGVEEQSCLTDPTHIETRYIDIDPDAHEWYPWKVRPAKPTEAGEKTRTCKLNPAHTDTEEIPSHTDCQWSDWEQTTAPTCTRQGEQTRDCPLDGGHSQTEPLDKLGHDWGEWTQKTEPTCTTAGVKTKTCDHNARHKRFKVVDINPDAHDWSGWTETTAPTCTTPGEETRTCAYDVEATHPETRDVAALGHNLDNWTVTTAPTCTEKGEETGTCTRNDSYIETRPVNALGHNWGAWVETTPPTCTTAGEETKTCTRDTAHTEKQEVKALGHNWGADNNCTRTGCGESKPTSVTRYLAFTSDVHWSNTNRTIYGLWMEGLKRNLTQQVPGATLEYMGFCGDLGNTATTGGTTATYWSYVDELMSAADTYVKNGFITGQNSGFNFRTGQNANLITGGNLFGLGNHEFSAGGDFGTNPNGTVTSRLMRNHTVIDEGDYIIYALGAASGTYEYTKTDVDTLSSYLAGTKGRNVPIFIMAHFPLHANSHRTTGGETKLLLDTLNDYPNVFFLWGHNHTEATSGNDPYLGKNTGPVLAGSKISLTWENGTGGGWGGGWPWGGGGTGNPGPEHDINFTYLYAGNMIDTGYGDSGDVKGKGSLISVEGNVVTITYYDNQGNPLAAPVTPVTTVTIQP